MTPSGKAAPVALDSTRASMDDKFHDECGVVGVYGHPEAATLAYLSLYALQHRGQESAGIVASNGEVLISHRGAKGGYRLARAPEEITAADIVCAVDGPIALEPGGARLVRFER